MTDFDRTFPPVLAELNQLEFEYGEGGGVDFEPYDEFQSAAENTDWIRAWTGNEKLTGAEYRIFGQDGTGGLAGFWLTRPEEEILHQPIVFFGSEGEVGVVAYDFADYLWILAAGLGPLELVEYGPESEENDPTFEAFAEEHAPDARKTAAEALERAKAAFPTFSEDFMKLCK